MVQLVRKHIWLGEFRPLDGAHAHFIEISKLISSFLICAIENDPVEVTNLYFPVCFKKFSAGTTIIGYSYMITRCCFMVIY